MIKYLTIIAYKCIYVNHSIGLRKGTFWVKIKTAAIYYSFISSSAAEYSSCGGSGSLIPVS